MIGVYKYLSVFLLLIMTISSVVSPALASAQIISLRPWTSKEDINCSIKEEENFTSITQKRLVQAQALGLDPAIFTNLEVRIHPSPTLRREQTQGVSSLAAGSAATFLSSDKKNIMSVIMLGVSSGEDVFYHELAHVVESYEIWTYGYDWAFINEFGQEYIKAKQYPHVDKLTSSEQVNLPWESRISEWFAEDVAQILFEIQGVYNYRHEAGPEKTKEVDELIKSYIFKQPEYNLGCAF